MTFDLLLKNGHVIDGSGGPSFHGDVAIRDGKIVEMGKLSGAAKRIIDVHGLVISPGFVDTHCHYDAQVTWDPLCTFSCYHGSTTVVIGNCSLALAPVRPHQRDRLAQMLSYIEAIPMDVLRTVDYSWETNAEYMAALDKRGLGVNVATLIGHTAVRLYVMGDDAQKRAANDFEIRKMQEIVEAAMKAGAIGLSFDRQYGHFDAEGVPIPAVVAEEEELFALGDVLRQLGTGVIQCGGGHDKEPENRLMSRLSEATGRTVIYNSLVQMPRLPDGWKKLMAIVDETTRAGIRAYPVCSPFPATNTFKMKDCQTFRGVPTWHPILFLSDAEKLRAYSDPAVRKQLHKETVEWTAPDIGKYLDRRWYDYVYVDVAALPKNKHVEGKNLTTIAAEQGKEIIDAFLDLVVEENLETQLTHHITNFEREAMLRILNYPNAIISLSDAGAHVQSGARYGFSTYFLSRWVRDEKIMPLERAVRRLTFEPASAFGIFDRGLLRPGMAADITVFDPDTVRSMPNEIVHDFPAKGWRIRQRAEGIKWTIVNGQVLLENETHSGALPGRVLRNALWMAGR